MSNIPQSKSKQRKKPIQRNVVSFLAFLEQIGLSVVDEEGTQHDAKMVAQKWFKEKQLERVRLGTHDEDGNKIVMTKVDATKRGLLTYYTGKPCCRGHLSLRYVSNKMCEQCVYENVAKKTPVDVETVKIERDIDGNHKLLNKVWGGVR